MLSRRIERSLKRLDKSAIRKEFRSRRKDITPKERQQAAESAVELFVKSPLFAKSDCIACYLPNDYEFDSTKLIEAIWQQKKKCYLPILSKEDGPELKFGYYSPETVMKRNHFNILEPTDSIYLEKDKLDIVFMPLVAFDQEGNRLGMGQGYYDRTFQFLLSSSQVKPLLVGLAFEKQCLSQIPKDPWDVPMRAILTEKQLRIFS